MRRPGSQNASRIRKKGTTAGQGGGADTSSSETKKGYRNIDVCHNGQIPACRLLHEALQDVFPELRQGTRPDQHPPLRQQQEHQDTDDGSSHLGLLFRRKFLSLRKSRRTFQHVATANVTPTVDSVHSLTPEVATTESAGGKKKKKRKKKRKGDGASTTSASQTGNENSSTVAASSALSTGEDLDTKSFMDHSVEALDESVKHHDNKIKQETTSSRPSLESLPSDDDDEELMGRKVSSRRGGGDGGGRRGGGELSPSRFFDQIKPQESPTSTSHNRTDEHDLRASTYEGGRPRNGTTATASPSQKGPSGYHLTHSDPTNNCSYIYSLGQDHHSSAAVSPTHEQVPEDSTSTQEDDYAKGDTMKDPLQLRYLVASIDTNGHFGAKEQADSDSTGCFPSNLQKYSLQSNNTTEPSNLERVRSVFSEWLDQQFWEDRATSIQNDTAVNQERSDWKSFVEFCNDRTFGQEKATGIPVQDLFDIAASIECEVCRTECLSEVTRLVGEETARTVTHPASSSGGEKSSTTKLSPMPPPVVVLKPQVLENKAAGSTGQEVSMEAAFDYVALEEGHHLPNHNLHRTHSVDDDDDEEEKHSQLLESNLSFVTAVLDSSRAKQTQALKISANTSSSRKQLLFVQKLTVQHLENLMADWLTMGIDEDVLVSISVKKRDKDYDEDEHSETLRNDTGNSDGGNRAPVHLSTGELHFFKKRVMEQQNDFSKSRDDMDHVKTNLIDHWNSVSRTLLTDMNMELTGYTVLKRCDEYCDKYVMESILPILSGQLSVPSHTLPDLQIKLWSLYLGALARTLQACDVYYSRLEELADQQGVLPKIFVCAPMRALYQDLIQVKVTVMTDLAASLTSALNDRVMKEWYTRVVWQDSNAEGASDESKSLDMDFQELLKELTEWTAAIQGSRMSAINRARYTQIEEVLESLQSIVDPLSHEYASVEPFFSREQKVYFDSLLSNTRHADGVKRRMRLIEKEDVISLAFGAILMWRHVRIAQSSMLISVCIPPLPLPLYHWMMLSDNPDLYGLSLNTSPCWSGWGGRRRVMCILAGVAYCWLNERCNEWKAEVAERELITHFEAGTLSSGPQKISDIEVPDDAGAGKSGKRRKKHKNKTLSSSSYGAHIDTKDATQGDKNSQDFADRTMTQHGDIQEPLEVTNQGGHSLNSGLNEEGWNGTDPEDCLPTEINTIAQEKTWEEMEQGLNSGFVSKVGNDDNSEIEVAEERHHNGDTNVGYPTVDDFDSSVLVQDDEGIESARNFLINRLVSMLNESESGTAVIISR
jgi:hypothetical protein